MPDCKSAILVSSNSKAATAGCGSGELAASLAVAIAGSEAALTLAKAAVCRKCRRDERLLGRRLVSKLLNSGLLK
jgi:hypothetical protein